MAKFTTNIKDYEDGGRDFYVQAIWFAERSEVQDPVVLIDVSTLEPVAGKAVTGIKILDLWASANLFDTNWTTDGDSVYLMDDENNIMHAIDAYHDNYMCWEPAAAAILSTKDFSNTANGDLKICAGRMTSWSSGSPSLSNVQPGSNYSITMRCRKVTD